MRYERSLEQIAGDDVRTAQLVEECVDLNVRLVAVHVPAPLCVPQAATHEASAEPHAGPAKARGRELQPRLANTALDMGNRLLYEEIIELIIRVSDRIIAHYEALQGKVRNAMGGEILELMHERAARLEREALAEGVKQGIEQGIEQGETDLMAQLKERGVDESVVAEALAAARASRNKASQEQQK